MRAILRLLLVLNFGLALQAQSFAQNSAEQEIEKQKAAQDVALALKQQREEAQDKLANAYVLIMKLQREVDQMKADQAKNAPPK